MKNIVVFALVFVLVFGRCAYAEEQSDEKELAYKTFQEWFSERDSEWLLEPPDSMVLKFDVYVVYFMEAEFVPVLREIIAMGPRPPELIDTPECIEWDSAVEALGPRPFKAYDREEVFEWDRKLKELGPRPKQESNKEAYDFWNKEFLRILQKWYEINKSRHSDIRNPKHSVSVWYSTFLSVYKIRLYEQMGYRITDMNVFKVQTTSGWYREVYFLLTLE
ncbi:MAG: hypothetical protein J7M30_09350 [Deltaproteobacteria bacterium]|nr:hypothetical protein [Deltaproteobacteria bacterium]